MLVQSKSSDVLGMFSKTGRFTSQKYSVFRKRNEILGNTQKTMKVTNFPLFSEKNLESENPNNISEAFNKIERRQKIEVELKSKLNRNTKEPMSQTVSRANHYVNKIQKANQADCGTYNPKLISKKQMILPDYYLETHRKTQPTRQYIQAHERVNHEIAHKEIYLIEKEERIQHSEHFNKFIELKEKSSMKSVPFFQKQVGREYDAVSKKRMTTGASMNENLTTQDNYMTTSMSQFEPNQTTRAFKNNRNQNQNQNKRQKTNNNKSQSDHQGTENEFDEQVEFDLQQQQMQYQTQHLNQDSNVRQSDLQTSSQSNLKNLKNQKYGQKNLTKQQFGKTFSNFQKQQAQQNCSNSKRHYFTATSKQFRNQGEDSQQDQQPLDPSQLTPEDKIQYLKLKHVQGYFNKGDLLNKPTVNMQLQSKRPALFQSPQENKYQIQYFPNFNFQRKKQDILCLPFEKMSDRTYQKARTVNEGASSFLHNVIESKRPKLKKLREQRNQGCFVNLKKNLPRVSDPNSNLPCFMAQQNPTRFGISQISAKTLKQNNYQDSGFMTVTSSFKPAVTQGRFATQPQDEDDSESSLDLDL